MQQEEANTRRFTWKELSQLNKKHNAHVAYKGKVSWILRWSLLVIFGIHLKVYDVSSFVLNHPGGVEQIMMAASHDITHIFELYHKPETKQ